MVAIVNAKKYSRKKIIDKPEHKINGKDVLEAIGAISSLHEIDKEELLNILEKNIHDVVTRKDKALKFANVKVNIDRKTGEIDINRIYNIKKEYSSTYEENCKEIIIDDIDDLKLDIKELNKNPEDYITINNELNIVLQKIDFKFERKIFEDLRGVIKGKISMTSKENKFEKLENLELPLNCIITNIKKGQMFLQHQELDFVLPFKEFEKQDSIKSYNIGDKITVVFDHVETLNNSVRYYVTRKVKKLIPALFLKYNYSVKNGDIEILDAYPFIHKDGYKVLVKNIHEKKEEALRNLIHSNSLNKIKMDLNMTSVKDNIIFLFAKTPEELIINSFYKMEINKLIFNEENKLYQLIVKTKNDKSQILKDLFHVKLMLKNNFGKYNIHVMTQEEFNLNELEDKNKIIIKLMKSLKINNEVAEILYNDYFDDIEIIAYSEDFEFDNIADKLAEFGLTIKNIKDKAKNHINNNSENNDEKIEELYNFDLNSDEIKLLSLKVKSKEELADLDVFELQEILEIDESRAKKVIMQARNLS